MLWFFDSGIGWFTAMRAFLHVFPDLDVIYLADQARCPYGEKTAEEVRQYTQEGVQYLFDHGASIVILACNTATAHAIRYLQQEVFPDRKILGVTIPWAERIVESGYKKVGILATESSVRIGAYSERVGILDSSVIVEEVAVPELVPLIESGQFDVPEVRDALRRACARFSPDIEAVVLGCTHYPLVLGSIAREVPDLAIIDPSRESARKFVDYLDRHHELRERVGFHRKTLLVTTGNLDTFKSQIMLLFRDFPDFLARNGACEKAFLIHG